MLSYLQELCSIWGNDAMKLFILKIGTCMYPILDAIGMGVNAPLALIVNDSSMAEMVFSEISGFGSSKMIPLGISKKQLENEILMCDYELIPILCDVKSRQNSVNIEMLKNAMMTKSIDEKTFYGLPIIAFCGSIPGEFAEFLSGKITIIGKKKINVIANREEIVRKIIQTFLNSPQTIEYMLPDSDQIPFLKGAVETCKVLLKLDNGIDEDAYLKISQNVEETLKDLEDEWEIIDDYSAWFEMLRDLMFKEAKHIYRIIDRNSVSISDEVILDGKPLYDSNFYYLTTEFFDEMCEKLPYVGAVELKKAMSDAGILIGEGANRSYLTVKVPIKTNIGVKITKRRLRVTRSWLDLPGELTWKEWIEMGLEEK